MGCSPSTLYTSDSVTDMPTPTTDPPGCARTCCPPVLHPPPIGSPFFVYPNSACPPDSLLNDNTWELIDYDDDEEEEEEEYHLVAQNQYKNSSLHKLLETYEIVEPRLSAVVDQGSSLLLDLNAAQTHTLSSVSPKTIDNSSDSKQLGFWSAKGKNDDKVVLYVTSMRGIRKTYDDCCAVKLILDGFRVAVNVRDIAMDVKYRRELQSLLGLDGKAIAVPQLFIGNKHVGGADQVERLYEFGELSKVLEECPVRQSTLVPCICGDARFLLCTHCSGSKKLFDEEHRFIRKCSHCNENGLVRCASCNT